MYSQNNEEMIIADYFGSFVGTFLDIGANDGITLSNSYALAEQGWKGLCVEASPNAFQQLVMTHALNDKIELLNYAIGSHNSRIVLHESGALLGAGDISLVSSTREDEVRRWDSLNIPFTDVEVDMIDIRAMLKMSDLKTFDLITIDIEGMEKEVVPQIDFNELATKMAVIEWNGKDFVFYDTIMHSFGFNEIARNQENLIYAR